MYRILSLSGGGARGIYQAVFLQAVENALVRPLHQRFDLIAGTSTGSIVAAGVAFDIGMSRIIELFRQVAPQIFAARWFSNIRKGPHYSSDALRECLNAVFEARKLGDAPTPLLIPATTLNRYSSRQFSTFAEEGVVYKGGEARIAGSDGSFSTPGVPRVNYIDPHLKVADVVLASCAAPSFFPRCALMTPRGGPTIAATWTGACGRTRRRWWRSSRRITT
jgi:patatin-like phospholipase/acyl hydrolase